MKKILLSLTMVAFFGLLMTSCGGDKKASKTNETKAEVKKETTKAEAKTASVDVSKMKANLENGKKVYSKACIACHFTGVSGAPALKADKYNKEDWQKRADKGMATLLEHSIKGFNNNLMPPKGTCMDCSEQDLFDAISYMYNEAKATIK